MTRTQSALNTLAEVAATELSQKIDPKGFSEQKSVAKRGGRVAVAVRPLSATPTWKSAMTLPYVTLPSVNPPTKLTRI